MASGAWLVLAVLVSMRFRFSLFMEHYSLCHPQDQTVQFIPCCPSSFSFVIFLCNLMLCTCVCICVLVHICFVIVIFVVNYFYVVSWLVVCVYLYPSTYVGEHVYRLSFCVTLSFDKIDNNNNNKLLSSCCRKTLVANFQLQNPLEMNASSAFLTLIFNSLKAFTQVWQKTVSSSSR